VQYGDAVEKDGEGITCVCIYDRAQERKGIKFAQRDEPFNPARWIQKIS